MQKKRGLFRNELSHEDILIKVGLLTFMQKQNSRYFVRGYTSFWVWSIWSQRYWAPVVNILSFFWLRSKCIQSLRKLPNFDFLLYDFWRRVDEFIDKSSHREDSSDDCAEPRCKVAKRPFLFAVLYHHGSKLIMEKNSWHTRFARHHGHSLRMTSDRKLTRLKYWSVQPGISTVT